MGGGRKNQRSWQFPIFNKDTLEDFVDSSDIELPAMPEQIYVLSDNIPGSEDNPSGSKVDRDLLDKSQGQNNAITLLPLL